MAGSVVDVDGVLLASGVDLPPLGWMPTSTENAVPYPDLVKPVVNEGSFAVLGISVLNKPMSGGLWTSPLVRADDPGQGTYWTGFARRALTEQRSDLGFVVEVVPDPDAVFAVVRDMVSLERLSERWSIPYEGEPLLPMMAQTHNKAIDFEAAAREVDGIYLTYSGALDTRRRIFGTSMKAWDVSTVLFLGGRFTVGRQWILRPGE